MKSKFLYLSMILIAVFTITSCASRKYGCPNATGMKMATPTTVNTAI